MAPSTINVRTESTPSLRRAATWWLVSLSLLAIVGTACMKLREPATPWWNAADAAVHAVCGTGAIDANTSGPIIHILIAQLSALATIIFGTSVLLGRRAAIRCVVCVLAIELAGGALMWAASRGDGDAALTWADALSLAIGAMGQKLSTGLDTSVSTLALPTAAAAAIMALMLIGSIGVPALVVVAAARQHTCPARAPMRWARPALIMSLALWLSGAGLLFAGRLTPHFYQAWHLGQTAHAADDTTIGATALGRYAGESLGQSISARSAGMGASESSDTGGLTTDRTANPGSAVSAGERVVLMVLMGIGGGPGSAAGGIGVVTFALLCGVTWTTLRGRTTDIPIAVTRRALQAVTVLGLWVVVTTVARALLDASSLQMGVTTSSDVLFEMVAACSAVGFPATQSDSPAVAALMAVAAMFGRIVPTLFAVAICAQLQRVSSTEVGNGR